MTELEKCALKAIEDSISKAGLAHYQLHAIPDLAQNKKTELIEIITEEIRAVDSWISALRSNK